MRCDLVRCGAVLCKARAETSLLRACKRPSFRPFTRLKRSPFVCDACLLFKALLHTVPELNIGDGPEQTKVRTKLLPIAFRHRPVRCRSLGRFCLLWDQLFASVLAHVDFSMDEGQQTVLLLSMGFFSSCHTQSVVCALFATLLPSTSASSTPAPCFVMAVWLRHPQPCRHSGVPSFETDAGVPIGFGFVASHDSHSSGCAQVAWCFTRHPDEHLVTPSSSATVVSRLVRSFLVCFPTRPRTGFCDATTGADLRQGAVFHVHRRGDGARGQPPEQAKECRALWHRGPRLCHAGTCVGCPQASPHLVRPAAGLPAGWLKPETARSHRQ